MKASCTAGGNYYSFCLCNSDFIGFHIKKNCTAGTTFIVQNKLDGCCKVNNRNFPVKNLVPEGSHYFCPGIILCSVHSLAACSSSMGGNHGSVRSFVKFHSKVVEPLDSFGSLAYKFL